MSKQSPEINLAGIKLSKQSSTPLYIQVYEQLRKMIINKRLRRGDRLPASRNLAKELSVSRIIISQGYEQLMIEGYLVGKTGSGTFVADTIPDQLLHAARINPNNNSKEIISGDNSYRQTELAPFQIGTPSLDAFSYKNWFDSANHVLKQLKKFHIGYDDTLGYWPLRKAIASYLRLSRAVRCEAEQVIVVTGSQQGLNLIVETLLKKGDKVWMEDPGYPGAKLSLEHAGANICPVPVEPDGININYAMKNFPDAKLAYVTPSHQFPLGCTLSQAKRMQLLDIAKKKNIWILEDDYDSEFRYEGSPLPSLHGLDNAGRVIYSGTFSKVLFPGLRLAYIVLPSAKMVDQFKVIKENLDRQSPVIDQLMLTRFMEQGHFLRHIRKMRMIYADRQKILIGLINEHLKNYFSVNAFPSGMHVLCIPKKKMDIKKFRDEIRKQKLSVTFIDDYSIKYKTPGAIALGFTAFSKYKLKSGMEKLVTAVEKTLSAVS